MDNLWLGYNGLNVSFADVIAVLLYQSAYDRLITRTYGHVPRGVRSIVVTSHGYLPARWQVEDLRRRWCSWRSHAGM